jgi:UDP-glucose 4-epimerase
MIISGRSLSRCVVRILVTGGAGYVGFPLCRQLANHGHDIIVIDNLVTTSDCLPALQQFVRVEQVDITDGAACVAAVAQARPECVVHLAALHFIPECNRRPVNAVMINVVGTQNVLDACSRVPDISRVVVTSSAAVYPVSDEFMQEESLAGPTDIYGITKAANERQGQQFAQVTGITTVAVRLFNVFGPGETNPHVVPEIIEQLRSQKYSLALGNVSPKRCYVYVDDVVDGFEALVTASLPPGYTTVNLGTSEEASVSELVDMISEMLGTRIEIRSDAARTRASDRPFLRCNPERMASLTGWRARWSIHEGLRQLLIAEHLL